MTTQSSSSLTQKEVKAFIDAGIAAVLRAGIRLVGQSIAHEPSQELLAILKATQFDPKDQEVIDFVIVMLTPDVATNLAEVRALIARAKKIIPELEGNFEESLRAIAKFEELSEGY
jgi:microcompartment protein CcmL/EutN